MKPKKFWVGTADFRLKFKVQTCTSVRLGYPAIGSRLRLRLVQGSIGYLLTLRRRQIGLNSYEIAI